MVYVDVLIVSPLDFLSFSLEKCADTIVPQLEHGITLLYKGRERDCLCFRGVQLNHISADQNLDRFPEKCWGVIGLLESHRNLQKYRRYIV